VNPAKLTAGTWDLPSTLTLVGGVRVIPNDYLIPASDSRRHGTAVEIVNPILYTKLATGSSSLTATPLSEALRITDALSSNPIYIFNVGNPKGEILQICNRDGLSTGSYGASRIELPRDGATNASYIALDQTNWLTMTSSVLGNAGLLACRYVGIDLDFHAYGHGYTQGGSVVGQGAQYHGPSNGGGLWIETYGSGGENSAPFAGYQESLIMSDRQGLRFKNHNPGLGNQGDLSASFNFDDSILTSGSLETSGSVRAAGDVYATVYHGSGASLTGVTATEADTLATVTGRGASTSTNVSFTGTTTLGSGGTAISKHLSANFTSQFFEYSAAYFEQLEVTVTGAVVGDSVTVTPDATLGNGCVYQAFVVSADTVRVNGLDAAQNGSDLTGSFRVDVWKH
jgi:hypothetical protein